MRPDGKGSEGIDQEYDLCEGREGAMSPPSLLETLPSFPCLLEHGDKIIIIKDQRLSFINKVM